MKVFKLASGKVMGSTLTVLELKKILNGYPDDMPVMAEWESVRAYIDPDDMYMERVNKGHFVDSETCLILDVNNY